jgi:hypothetical protein
MNTAEQPIRIAGRTLGPVRHICAFFHRKEDEYRVLQDFIQEGIACGEKAVHIVDARQRQTHRTHLRQRGIDVECAENCGQLRIATWDDAYLKDGYFDQDRQLRLIKDTLTAVREEGFPLARLVANMEWALEEKAGVGNIVEYESRLNYFLPNFPDPVICTYDLARFNGGVVIDILRAHPMVIIGGVLQENPLYVPPDEFLTELRARNEFTAAPCSGQW